MPARPVVVAIVLFWLAMLGVVVYREVIPRFFGDTPPVPQFVAVDELSPATVTWVIYRGPANKPDADEPIGKMNSRTEYVRADDTFRYVNSYHGVKLKLYGVDLSVPTATTTLRIDRDGRLKEQTLRGTAELEHRLVGKLTATAEATGVVKDDVLTGSANLTVPGWFDEPAAGTFTPVPVPDGQVLNPLMPLDRLGGVTPGRRWVVTQVDPMREALGELLMKGLQEELAKQGGGKKKAAAVTLPPAPELLAEVLREPVTLDRPGGPVACWVIEYTSKDPPILARTYVGRDDGRVLRQEATSAGDRLRFERQD